MKASRAPVPETSRIQWTGPNPREQRRGRARRVLLAMLAVLVLAACSPATTRRLCDVSEVVEHAAPKPESPKGKAALEIGWGLLRAILCPRASGATD